MQEKLTDILCASTENAISIELLPNKPVDLNRLKQVQPQFCSVTWHEDPANFAPQNIASVQLARQLLENEHHVLLHMAVRNFTAKKALEVLHYLKEIGLRNVLIVQGDASTATNLSKGYYDFQYAIDMIKFIRSNFGNYFCIGIAAYPETESNFHHFESKASVADFIITQATFNYAAVSEFANKCKTLAINIPIVVGIFIIDSKKALSGMIKFSGVPIPPEIMQFVQKQDEETEIKEFGMQVAAEMIERIIKDGEGGGGGLVHVFSMNNLDLYEGVLKKIAKCGKNATSAYKC